MFSAVITEEVKEAERMKNHLKKNVWILRIDLILQFAAYEVT